ncbi:MAG TPA: hypothetical protein VK582_09800 [Pyrinomonadaceae bacterium]|nr:hypothetical protein [Pyrinomonadaceae bacterium]
MRTVKLATGTEPRAVATGCGHSTWEYGQDKELLIRGLNGGIRSLPLAVLYQIDFA